MVGPSRLALDESHLPIFADRSLQHDAAPILLEQLNRLGFVSLHVPGIWQLTKSSYDAVDSALTQDTPTLRDLSLIHISEPTRPY